MTNLTTMLNKLLRPSDALCHPAMQALSLARIDSYEPLLTLQDRRQLLEVEVFSQGRRRSFQSMVVSVDFVAKVLYLDTLVPSDPLEPVRIGDQLTISHPDGERILFVTGQLLAITDDAAPLYAVPLPEQVGYMNRRFYPRWQPQRNAGLAVQLHSPTGEPWHAHVSDISAGGAKLHIGGKVADDLRIGDHLPSCKLSIPGGPRLRCEATVKACRFLRKPYAHTELRIAFDNINIQDRLRLQDYIQKQLTLINPPA